jgi:hypothetical protein
VKESCGGLLPSVVPSLSIVQFVHRLYYVGADATPKEMLRCEVQKGEITIVAKTQIRSDDFAGALERFLADGSIGDLYEANAPHLPADKEERKYGAKTIS